jgi:hypothetical protein
MDSMLVAGMRSIFKQGLPLALVFAADRSPIHKTSMTATTMTTVAKKPTATVSRHLSLVYKVMDHLPNVELEPALQKYVPFLADKKNKIVRYGDTINYNCIELEYKN